MKLHLPGIGDWLLDRPRLIGIVNVTPDSFSDGGLALDPDQALSHAMRLVADGADALDVGGESTRPGAVRISVQEQIARVVPVIERLVSHLKVPISIDTTHREVASAALDAGAHWINDVSAGEDDPTLMDLAATRGVPMVLMHKRGEPASMQDAPNYDDVVAEVGAYLMARRDHAVRGHGMDPSQVVLDPGIGFGKTTAHNLALLAAMPQLAALGGAWLLGASRKRFLGELTGVDQPADRDVATAVTTALGVSAGFQLFRVHAPAPNRQAADVTFALDAHRKA